MMLTVGTLLPALGNLFDSARAPDARNLMSAHLAGARNYAVANSVTTALVFTENEDAPETKRRMLMYLARYDPTNTNFTVVPGRETTYLPDNIVISDDDNDDDLEDSVVICFSAAGQLTAGRSFVIDSPPIGSAIDLGDNINSVANFWLYDAVGSDPAESLQINYYTGVVIKQ